MRFKDNMVKECGLIIGDNEKECIMCKDPTKFIDICSEAHMCSTECQEKFYKQYEEYLKQLPEELK